MLEDLDPEPDSYLVLMDLDAGGKKHTDTTDPDPQNWYGLDVRQQAFKGLYHNSTEPVVVKNVKNLYY